MAYREPERILEKTPEQWAAKHIIGKARKLINGLLKKAVATEPHIEGSPVVPSLQELQGIRKLEFRLDGNAPELRASVTSALKELRAEFPDWTFEVRFGIDLLVPPFPQEGEEGK